MPAGAQPSDWQSANIVRRSGRAANIAGIQPLTKYPGSLRINKKISDYRAVGLGVPRQ
jgi:hypothetical protein